MLVVGNYKLHLFFFAEVGHHEWRKLIGWDMKNPVFFA